ncbi:hypothetical protein FACS1894124_6340 [Spirochaetia bacterium]|nr:hypothetical protein FACS1894124_6340 [Spirochaetia bacterium]
MVTAGAFAQAAGAAPSGAAGPAGPDTVRRITPDEAVDLAIRNNLSLESARITLDTKKRKSSFVWNQFLPDLAVNGTLNRSNEKSEGTTLPLPEAMGGPITMGATPQWALVGNFSASLTLTAALGAGIQATRRDYQMGLLTFDKAKLQTERDVRKAYYSMLLLGENIVLLKESAAAADRQVAMAQANYRAGLAAQLSLLQAQVAAENLKPTIDQMENTLKLAMARFAMDLGLPYDTQFELVPVQGEIDYIPLDMAELISKASRNKPEILELQAAIRAQQSARTAQLLQQRTPYLRLSWGLSPTFTQDPWKDSWGEKDNWMDRGAFSVTLGLGINGLFPFSKEWQGIKDLENSLRTSTIGLTQTIRGTELEIYNTVLSLEKTRVTAEAQTRTVNLAEQSYRLTVEAYRAGLSDFLQVQNADLELRKAKAGMMEQQFNYLTSLIDLEYSLGVPFGTLSSSGLKSNGPQSAGGAK